MMPKGWGGDRSSGRRGALAAKQVRAALVGILLMACQPATAETLSEALSAAYRYNPRLDAQRASLRASDEDVARAMSGYRPIINAQADGRVLRTDVRPSSPNDGVTYPHGYQIDLVQPLFSGFRTRNAVNAAEANVRAEREVLRDVERSILLQAAQAYVDVVRDQAIVRLQENNVQVLSRELKATQERFAVGEVTRTDVAQAQARRANSVSALDLARANVQTSRGFFEQIIGHPPEGLSEPPVPERVLPNSLEESIAVSDADNPLIVAALYREQAGRFNVDQIRGELLPTAQLEANYTDRFDTSKTTDEVEQGSVTGRVFIPIYENGDVYARVRQAKHQHVGLIQQIEQVRREQNQSANSAWSQLVAARAQVESDRIAVNSNRTALTGVREEERVGQRTLLDVLNAEQELLNAQVQLVTDQRNLIVAAYALLSAIGRLDATQIAIAATVYDPEQHYLEVRRKWWGLRITDEHGRTEFLDLWNDRGRYEPVK